MSIRSVIFWENNLLVMAGMRIVAELVVSSTQCSTITHETRRYPWGIQWFVSIHQFPDLSKSALSGGGGSGGGPQQLNPKSQDLSKFVFLGGWGWGEGVVVQTNIPEILDWGHSRNFEHKFCLPCHTLAVLASQIVSHTPRVWRLTSFH